MDRSPRIEQALAAEDIVRALAATPEPLGVTMRDGGVDRRCVLCTSSAVHFGACPWVTAREWVEAH